MSRLSPHHAPSTLTTRHPPSPHWTSLLFLRIARLFARVDGDNDDDDDHDNNNSNSNHNHNHNNHNNKNNVDSALPPANRLSTPVMPVYACLCLSTPVYACRRPSPFAQVSPP
ncbi:hypothetical protein EKO04_008372 [Ascochyta lentis]|uniref:Uncharacterized protein n=1 Tax=Ascochyta lentis TaxID=205686 RepID=A0A8H7IX30_9PLEO|nr:hypothetical protein EKO04_008372 [Ascochyta lentis]